MSCFQGKRLKMWCKVIKKNIHMRSSVLRFGKSIPNEIQLKDQETDTWCVERRKLQKKVEYPLNLITCVHFVDTVRINRPWARDAVTPNDVNTNPKIFAYWVENSFA